MMTTTIKPPDDLESLMLAIRERYDTLSDRLQRLARHILDEPNDLAFETVAVVAERSNVQPSAIVRFAQAFGFSGASPMQRLIREGLLTVDRSLGYAERIRQHRYAAAGEQDGPREWLSEFVRGNILALENLNHSVGMRELTEAIDLIEKANTVYVVGFRRSFPVATYLAYMLAQADKRTVLVDGVGGLHSQQVRGLQKEDLLIVISYAPYSPEAVALVDTFTTQGAVIAITDSVIGAVAKDSALVFQVRESEVRGFRSLSASMCLAQSLAIGLAAQKMPVNDD